MTTKHIDEHQTTRLNKEAVDEINWLYNQLEAARSVRILLTAAIIGLGLISTGLFIIVYNAGLASSL